MGRDDDRYQDWNDPDTEDQQRPPRPSRSPRQPRFDEDETPSNPIPRRASRDPYGLDYPTRQRPKQPRPSSDSSDTSVTFDRRRSKQTGDPGRRPQSRASNDSPDTSVTFNRRYVPRQPGPARPDRYSTREDYDDEEYAPPPMRKSSRRSTRLDHEDNFYDDDHRYERPLPRRRKRGRGVLSTLFIGFLGALLGIALLVGALAFFVLHNTPLGASLGRSNYTQQQKQTVTLTGATALIVKNRVGDVTITTNPTATDITLTSEKKVQAHNTGEASTEFARITLTNKLIHTGDDPACIAATCLLITGAVPDTGGGLFSGSIDSMNLTLVVPSTLSTPTTPFLMSVSSATGNIAVADFSGILNLFADTGNLTVTHGLLSAGTCIQTLKGNVTVGSGTNFNLSQPSNAVPCSSTPTTNEHPWFSIKSGTGNVDVTLPALSTNLLLDANTNKGQITTDFGLNITTNSDGSATFHGPLTPGASPTASLYLSTSTGNITVHR